MHRMFDCCRGLEYLDLNNFRTPSLINMKQIFNGCESMKWINISNFDTSQVTNMASTV